MIDTDEASGPADSGLLAGLSLDEKAALTAGADIWRTVPVERLGIPSLQLTDGPAGARGDRFTGDPSTSLPSGTALAATWDRDLVQRVGRLLGDEARSKGAQVLLAPTVNLHRHPLGGRNFECFSEDPYLTSELAVAYIRGVQERGVACAVKHFVANDQEHDRMEVSVEVDERTLHEVYLAPFEAAVRDAGTWALMAAYNRLHGAHCSEHPGLLDGILRREWGFDGLVVSDWYGTHSTAAVAAGLDLEMPGPPSFLGHYLAAAVRQGDIPEAVLDRAVARLLRLVARVTARQDEDLPSGEDPGALAEQAAREAIVLLRNQDRVLPLVPAPNGSTIAVLGPKADRPDSQGGGSAHVDPPYVVTPLDGIRQRAAREAVAVTIRHEPGVVQRAPATLGVGELRVPGQGDEAGLLVEHFAGPAIGGTPIHREVVPQTRLLWLGAPVPGLSPDEFSVRASADLAPDRSGVWRFSLASAGGSRLLVDGEVLIDNLEPVRGRTFFGRGSVEVEGQRELATGSSYRLEIELHSQTASRTWMSGVQLTARPPDDPDALHRAVAAARDADTAVVVVGAAVPDTEGNDRSSIDLPADQNELVRAVAAVNPATVVVVNSGSPVAMDWVDEVAGVVQLWYLGQETGTALAEVLFGDTDAAGRSPTTLPRHLEDTPAFASYPGTHGRAPYTEGVFLGYRHYDANRIEPLFCFGHGLSYTEFRYENLVVTLQDGSAEGPRKGPGDRAGEAVVVSVDVTNVGPRPGREVVQVYLLDVEASVERPERELKQFAKVDLAAGETRRVRMALPRRALAFWDAQHRKWVVEPGEFEVAVGSSSRAIHATARITVA